MARMRRFGGALVAVAVLACASGRAQVPDDGGSNEPAPTEVAPDPELSKSFAKMREQLQRKRPGISSLRSAGLNGACKSVKAYSRTTVERAYNQLQTEVFDQVKDPAAAPLKDLLEKEFPPLPEAKTSECYGATPVYERTVVDSLWERCVKFLGFASEAAKPMAVKVTTTPEEAIAQVRPAVGPQAPASKWTDCTFEGLYRGVYRVRVNKDGYKPFDEELGVLAGDSVTVHCKLAASGAGEPSRCAVQD